jgi:hypothetical protein
MLKFKNIILYSSLLFLIFSSSALAATIDVGHGYTYTTIASGVSAANSGDSVHVHAGTYVLTSSIAVKSGITLYGDGYSNTIIKSTSKSDFASEENWAFFTLTSCSGNEIYGFTFQGPASSLSDIHDDSQPYYGGHDDYHAAIRVSSCSNVKIHDCYFTLLLGDGVKSSTSGNSNIHVYNNQFNTAGHDAISLWNVKDWHISNNLIKIFVNSGLRLADSPSSSTEIDHNTFTYDSSHSGWTAIQLQGATTGANIHNNIYK